MGLLYRAVLSKDKNTESDKSGSVLFPRNIENEISGLIKAERFLHVFILERSEQFSELFFSRINDSVEKIGLAVLLQSKRALMLISQNYDAEVLVQRMTQDFGARTVLHFELVAGSPKTAFSSLCRRIQAY
jgi:hypothetical protein